MSPPGVAQTDREGAAESPEVRRIRRELAEVADELVNEIAETTRALAQAQRRQERVGQLSEALRVATIPPAQRKRPTRLASRRA